MRMPAKAGPNTVSRYEKPGSEKNVNPLVSPKAPLRSLVKGRCRVVGPVALSPSEGNLGAGDRRASHEILCRPLLRMTAVREAPTEAGRASGWRWHPPCHSERRPQHRAAPPFAAKESGEVQGRGSGGLSLAEGNLGAGDRRAVSRDSSS